MKLKYLLIAIVIVTTGCQGQTPEPSSADNDLLEVDGANKLLTAADVDLSEPYYFAYNEQPIENYDTYGTVNPVTVSVDQATTLNIYGSDEPLESVDVTSPYVTVDVDAGDTYIFESAFTYYEIDSSNPTSGVVAVS